MIVWLFNSVPVLAAGQINKNSVAQPVTQRVSSKLIVKFKPNDLPKGMSVAQINAHMSQALTAQTVSQLQTAAGVALQQTHAISNGAHVLAVSGKPSRKTMDAAIAGIARLPNVEYVEEDIILTPQILFPNDTYYFAGPGAFPGQWDMQPASAVAAPASSGTGNYGADFETAWASVTGTGVVVAVIDTGITPHEDIDGTGTAPLAATGNLVSVGYDFITDCRTRASCPASTPADGSQVAIPSPDATDLGDWISAQDRIDNADWATTPISNSGWHGTHVAGTIAALGNNMTGVIGGAYNAKILPVRALGKGGGNLSDIAEAVRWAAGVHAIANPNPAKVINMSLGGQAACLVTLQNAINAAVAAGTVVVVAAGNDNMDASNFTPANCANVVTVAATARDGSRAAYSNYSTTQVTLAAPGGDMNSGYLTSYDYGIHSTVNSGTTTPISPAGSAYAYYNGTSMAAPHVAAAAALMLERNPGLTPAQIKTVLSSTASVTAFADFGGAMGAFDCLVAQNCGSGVLNAKLAVQNSIFSLTPVGSSDFGSVPTGSTSSSKLISFVNGSSVSVRTGTPAITGADAARFSIVSNNCNGATVAPSASCTITLTYTPVSSLTPHSATLTVPTADASVASIVTLVGQPGSALTTLTPTVTATTVTVGQTTTANVTFRNPGATAQPTGSVVLSQPGIMATSADACSNVTLAAATSCVVTVTVSPSVAGTYSGTASLGLSGGGTAAVATISGTANPAPAPAASGGGGCSVMPFGATPDVSLLLAMLAVGLYWMRRRVIR